MASIEREEVKRRARNLIKYSVLVVVIIIIASVSLYVYFFILAPGSSTEAPLVFRSEYTWTITQAADGTFVVSPTDSWEFDYQGVKGTVTSCKLYLNFTRVDVTGGIEFRDWSCYSRDISAHRLDVYDFDVAMLSKGSNTIGFVNWNFDGSFQAIVVVEGTP